MVHKPIKTYHQWRAELNSSILESSLTKDEERLIDTWMELAWNAAMEAYTGKQREMRMALNKAHLESQEEHVSLPTPKGSTLAVEIVEKERNPFFYGSGAEPGRWRHETCQRCHRRNPVGFEVDDESWESVVRGRWDKVCLACFDEESQAVGHRYRLLGTWPVAYWDKPSLAPPVGPQEEPQPPCPVCGSEERSGGAGYLLCECPDPEATARLVKERPAAKPQEAKEGQHLTDTELAAERGYGGDV